MPEPGTGQAAEIIRKGGVVAFPTETVYGLGADAYNAMAVARIFEIKGRPRFDPLIVHIDSIAMAREITPGLNGTAQRLASRFWPGPLTIVLQKNPAVPGIVTSGLPTVAVRMPDHPVARELIRQAGVPVAAPSANPFGRISPTTAEHVLHQLGGRADMVLDGGPCAVGVESTIVSFADDQPELLRAGGTPLEEIEEIIGPLLRAPGPSDSPTAPGQLDSHYAPGPPLYVRSGGAFLQDPPHPPGAVRAGLLAFRRPADAGDFAAVEVLSAEGDLREAAANLFAALHRLDSLELDYIAAETFPEEGLGAAINDRLRRAASK